MAYRANDLNVLAYANGFTLWHYAAGEDSGRIAEQGYFNAANDPWPTLKPGDWILWTAGGSGGQLIVTDSAAGSVAVAAMHRMPPAAETASTRISG